MQTYIKKFSYLCIFLKNRVYCLGRMEKVTVTFVRSKVRDAFAFSNPNGIKCSTVLLAI